MNKYGLLILVMLAAAILVVACAAPAPTPAPVQPTTAATQAAPVPPRPSGAKVVRINMGAYPDNFDPQKASFVNEIAVLQLAYEGLTKLDPKGNVIAGQAEKWTPSSDGKTLTFTLRSGLKRVDGSAITAKDFEYAFKRNIVTDGEYNTLTDDIVGAVDARNAAGKKGATKTEIDAALTKVGIKAVDDKTLEVKFSAPVGFWNYIAYTWVGWPSDQSKVDKDPQNWWTKAENHNGNGPFKIAKIEENKVITFVPNPNYWGAKPKIDRIEMLWITDSAVSFEAYRKGEIDLVGLAAEDLATASNDSVLKNEVLRGPSAASYYMGLHNGKPPFDNKAVRAAFSQGFDRVTWVRDILKGIGKPYLSWIPPGIPGSDESAVQKGYDPKAAVQGLLDAGFADAASTAAKPKVDCAKLGQLKITYSGTPRNHARYQYIAGNFAQVLGCPVTLDPVDSTVFTALVKKVETAPQVFLLGWIQDYPHPQNWLFIEACDGLFASRISYCNKDFDKALQAANEETDAGKAIDKYKAAQKIFVNDYAGGMLYYGEYTYMVKPYLQGLKEQFGTSDAGFPGQFGDITKWDVDLTKVPTNYPKQ